MTDNIYREAGFESVRGKLAVALVVMNRLHDPKYPKTICGVIYERRLDPRTHKIVCQFSWTCEGPRKANRRMYEESYKIAKEVILKDVNVEEFDDVLHYHADYVHPRWTSHQPVFQQIGRHMFYKNVDAPLYH